MNWIHDGLVLTFALAGGILWTIISHIRNNPRTEYRTLHAWLRFFLRLTCGMFMIGYGLATVFPFQMPPPSVAILTEPAGNMAPMTFLWNLIGLSPVYEIICGSAEVLGGILLLYRRTGLAGALFSTFVITNVVLYNFCYDVPVKLFAANLLLGCIFLAVPDALSLCRFFWSHKPAAPTAAWVPPISRRAGRNAILVTEIIFAVAFLIVRPIFMTIGWHQLQVALHTPSPLVGAWHLDPTHQASGAFIDPEGRSITDLYVAPSGRAYTRSTNGELWLSGVDLDHKKHTVRISCYFIAAPTNYAWQLPDPKHLALTSVPPDPPKPDPKHTPVKPATPFAPAARDTLVSQYRRSLQAFANGLKIEHQLAQILLHGSPSEQMQARTIAWLGWIEAAPSNPLTTRWVATVRGHDVPVVSANGVVVTNRQIGALFVSNDWVAKAANLPPSTAESRAAFTESLPGRFGSMSQAERQQVALADLRWDALRGVLQFGLQEKAASIARMNVHGASDVNGGARHLEDAALEFDRGVQQLNKQVSDRAIALMGGVGDGAVAESINSARDRFEGKFDANRHH